MNGKKGNSIFFQQCGTGKTKEEYRWWGNNDPMCP